MIIRPAKTDDIDYIEELAKKGLSGLTTLPADRVQLFQKISDSMTAFSSKKNKPGNQCYFFVLEDTKKRKVAGTSAIIAAVGINEPFYSYKKNVVVHASNSLNIYNKYTTLHLSNDYTGCSELCTLFLDKEYRENNLGKLLSFSRFLFMAGFPDMFAEKVIAELRGESDEKGKSPFWEGFGRHFFSMDFTKADFLSGTGNKSFIAELMPRHPVYINLLSKKAQNTIGKVHKATYPAFKMLEKQGFSFQGYVDIFDAGPTIEAQKNNIILIRSCRQYRICIKNIKTSKKITYIISNNRLSDFRCCLIKPDFEHDKIIIDKNCARQLQVDTDDLIIAAPLN